ncbi:hypothetical protein [Chlorogloeopsis sp. ULAP02]|uniref:hypothetical protein n=1 Tax=Chlorogloeopsis sp. ULAP02 TaxID=3107926 RepID=UPI0031362879
MTNIESRQDKQKFLGKCLVKAGLITPDQLKTALSEQVSSDRKLQEILTMRGWVEQQTIDFFMENLVFTNLLIAKEKQLFQNRDNRQDNNFLEQTKSRYIDSVNSGLTLQKVLLCLSPQNTLRLLFLLIIFLCTINLAGQFSLYFLPDYPLRDLLVYLFNVDQERNFPSLYSGIALLFCSILLFLITSAKKIAGEAHISHWRALTIIFVCLSIDELMSFHELLIAPTQKLFNTSGFLYFAWVIPGAIFVLMFLLAFLKFITALPKKIKRLFLIAGTIYISGTIGIEMLGGYQANLYGQDNIIYAVITTIEEFLEMLGIVIFIYALMSYISTHIKGISLNIIINHNQKIVNN